MKLCPICGRRLWTDLGYRDHIIVEHAWPALKWKIMTGERSDWPCQAPTHAQVMATNDYSHNLIPWQDEIAAILDAKYRNGNGGLAA